MEWVNGIQNVSLEQQYLGGQRLKKKELAHTEFTPKYCNNKAIIYSVGPFQRSTDINFAK